MTTAFHYRGKNDLGLITADWKWVLKGWSMNSNLNIWFELWKFELCLTSLMSTSQLTSQFEFSLAVNKYVSDISAKSPTYDVIACLFMFTSLPSIFVHWYCRDPTDSSLHINRQRDSHVALFLVACQPRLNRQPLHWKCLLCFHYHRKKDRLLFPTNSDCWLHWIYSNIEETHLLPCHIQMIL